MCLDGEKNDRVAFQARADYQNHAIGWLRRGYSSLGGGKVVRIPRIWMVYGECRIKEKTGFMEDPIQRHPTRAEQLDILATVLADTVPDGGRLLDLG